MPASWYSTPYQNILKKAKLDFLYRDCKYRWLQHSDESYHLDRNSYILSST